ncbi:hypothetical protein ACWCYY_23340 [Kitasatospora sp. NPDC001664]
MTGFTGSRVRTALASAGTFALVLLTAPPAGATTGAPAVPTDLFNGLNFCSTAPGAPTRLWGGNGVELMGVPQHTYPTGHPYLAAEYRFWPVEDPARTATLTSTEVSTRFEAPVTVPMAALTEGPTYGWAVRSVAGSEVSGWSAPCYFAVDNTRPATAPLVTSSNYPEGKWSDGGEPVEFTFDANGTGDVAGFEFSWGELPVHGTAIGQYGIPKPTDPYADADHYVRADRLGGRATVKLLPPAGWFSRHTLTVVSLDRSMNQSSRVTYQFNLRSTAPSVAAVPPLVELGTTVPLRLTPNAHAQSVSRIVSYAVEIESEDDTRTVEVAARKDGTAVLPVLLTEGTSLRVSSRSANGWISDERWWFSGEAVATGVGSAVYPENRCGGGVGTPGTFTFTPHAPGVVSYVYSVDGGEEHTLPARHHGRATLTWTPTESGDHYLDVRARTADGREFGSRPYGFCVT